MNQTNDPYPDAMWFFIMLSCFSLSKDNLPYMVKIKFITKTIISHYSNNGLINIEGAIGQV